MKVHYNGAYSANPAPYNGQDNYYDCHYKDANGNPTYISGYSPRVRLVALITMYSMALYVLFKVMLKVVFQLPPIGIPSNHC